MRFYGTTARNEDIEQTTVSAQLNAIFSLQRFYELKKNLEKKENCRRSRKLNDFITALLWTINKGRQGITTNEKPNNFRLKNRTKTTNKQQKNDKRKRLIRTQ